MVVPLKLTQFYGHKVPRPRVYPDVKFNDQRVDPPVPVNDALLSWAADAHWSMGGLSFKRLRTQGKVEGNVRRLRAMLEDESDENSADVKVSSISKGARISDAGTPRASARGELAGSAKVVRSDDEEIVEATPAGKLCRRELARGSDVETPRVAVATEERGPAFSKSRSVSGLEESNSSDSRKKRGQQSPYAESTPIVTPTEVPATVDRNGKRGRAAETTKSVRGSIDAMPGSKGSEDARLTRSAKKTSVDKGTADLPVKTKISRVRKILMVSDSVSNDSDEGPEQFLNKEQPQPALRRSNRHVKTESRFSESESNSA